MKAQRFFSLFFLVLSTFKAPASIVPVTSLPAREPSPAAISIVMPSLTSFRTTISNGQTGVLTGVYVPGVMAYPIIQQPGSDAGYVSNQPATITQFRLATTYHSIGLLAHDFLAGAVFNNLQNGQDVVLIYGDGAQKFYRIFDIQRYRALSPTSPYSNFIDLSSNSTLSAEQLFFRTYGKGSSTLVFQTCISTEKVTSWGRLFVLAKPVEANHPGLLQAFAVIEQALTGASRSLSPLRAAFADR